jgi:hypothetical protein
MKYISIFILAAVCQINIQAQKLTEANVPEAVKNSFHTMFANTTVTQWEMEGANYEATYQVNGQAHAAIYAADGKFLQYESPATMNTVPDQAKKYITTNMPGLRIGTVTAVKNVAGDMSYRINVGGTDYMFDRSGNLIQK